MNTQYNKALKSLYPPTPAAVSRKVAEALHSLPRRKARWPWQIAKAAMGTAVICAAFIALYNIPSLPGKDLVKTPAPTQAAVLANTTKAPTNDKTASRTASPAETDILLPTPAPVGKLPQLVVTTPAKAPSSADGWQAAAVSGKVTWYYNPAASALARVESGKTVAIALDTPAGQTVDAYTFLPSGDGRWLAFTVHSGSGDTIWLVTKDGRKLDISKDVNWVDSDYKPVQVSLANLTMFPYGSRLEFPKAQEDISADSLIDDVEICAYDADGTVYDVQVALDTYSGYQSFALNDRRGSFGYNQQNLGPGEGIVASGEMLYKLSLGENQKYTIAMKSGAGQSATLSLQQNKFALFKSTGDDGRSAPLTYALVIYKNDPQRTLWELNIETGNSKKITTGCLAAAGLGDGTYWYTSSGDPASIRKQTADKSKTVSLKASLGVAVYPPNYQSDMAGKVVLNPVVKVQNNTGKDITIPDTVNCSLQLTRDGRTVWQKTGDLKLTDAKFIRIGKIGKGAEQVEQGPYILKNGEELVVDLAEVVYEEPGTYSLEGQFYNKTVNVQIALPEAQPLPEGVAVQAKLNAQGKLCVTYNNQSHDEYWIPQTSIDNAATDWYPPMMCYRLYNGDQVVKSGMLQMSERALTSKESTIPKGKTYTLVEPGNEPCFADLPAGDYRLEFYMQVNCGDETTPWGFATGPFVTAELKIPTK
jgi:hypothetical protein